MTRKELLEEVLENLTGQACSGIIDGWVCIPTVEWNANIDLLQTGTTKKFDGQIDLLQTGTTQKFDGQLEIDNKTGIIYFYYQGVTLLRICRLPTPIPKKVKNNSILLIDSELIGTKQKG